MTKITESSDYDVAAVINALASTIEATSASKGFMRATWDIGQRTVATKREYCISACGGYALGLARVAEALRQGRDAVALRAIAEVREDLESATLCRLDDADVLSGRETNDVKLALVVTELAELRDAIIDDDRNNAAEEVADAIIRLLDIGASLKLDVGRALVAKMKKNTERPPLHGKVSSA